MNTKILIEVRGGYIKAIHTTTDEINIVIIDYDNINVGESPVSGILSPDSIFSPGDAFMLFTENNPETIEVREYLKQIKF